MKFATVCMCLIRLIVFVLLLYNTFSAIAMYFGSFCAFGGNIYLLHFYHFFGIISLSTQMYALLKRLIN